jgi:hypothetical protein
VFVEHVDVVTGVGYDRAAASAPGVALPRDPLRGVEPGRFDFDTPDHRMRLRSVHPWASVADVEAATGFELLDRVAETRCPPTRSCSSSVR